MFKNLKVTYFCEWMKVASKVINIVKDRGLVDYQKQCSTPNFFKCMGFYRENLRFKNRSVAHKKLFSVPNPNIESFVFDSFDEFRQRIITKLHKIVVLTHILGPVHIHKDDFICARWTAKYSLSFGICGRICRNWRQLKFLFKITEIQTSKKFVVINILQCLSVG